jgi:hypothetical protein
MIEGTGSEGRPGAGQGGGGPGGWHRQMGGLGWVEGEIREEDAMESSLVRSGLKSMHCLTGRQGRVSGRCVAGERS